MKDGWIGKRRGSGGGERVCISVTKRGASASTQRETLVAIRKTLWNVCPKCGERFQHVYSHSLFCSLPALLSINLVYSL